ncbi:hypothetical protein TrRE_jg11853, partial [Triparma retinervis]
MRYFLVDSRVRKSGEMKGKFPTSIIVTPEVMLDSERLVEVLKDFEVLRGEATLVVMGEGVGVAKTEYGIELSKKARREMEEDESRTESLALFFVKRGFPYTAVMEGGFGSASGWLHREGMKDLLEDYDPDVCMWTKMEESRGG